MKIFTLVGIRVSTYPTPAFHIYINTGSVSQHRAFFSTYSDSSRNLGSAVGCPKISRIPKISGFPEILVPRFSLEGDWCKLVCDISGQTINGVFTTELIELATKSA